MIFDFPQSLRVCALFGTLLGGASDPACERSPERLVCSTARPRDVSARRSCCPNCLLFRSVCPAFWCTQFPYFIIYYCTLKFSFKLLSRSRRVSQKVLLVSVFCLPSVPIFLDSSQETCRIWLCPQVGHVCRQTPVILIFQNISE